MDSQIVLSICQIAAVVIIPLFVWYVGKADEKRKSKLNAKKELFFTLMKNRKSFYATKEKVDALNLIDVVFQNDKNVRNAWKDYLDSLNANSPNFSNNNSYLLDLLSEMAITLGYKELKQTEIDRFYEPQVYIDDHNAKHRIDSELYRVLMSSKSFSDSRSDEELKEAIESNRG